MSEIAIIASIFPPVVGFSKSPVILSVSVLEDDAPLSDADITVEINSRGKTVYEGYYTADASGCLRTDLKDILEGIVQPHSVSETGAVILPVSLISDVDIIINAAGADESRQYRLLYGRIPGRQLGALAQRGVSPLSFRLLNRNGNFLMQTRSAALAMQYYREELVPLYFISAGGRLSVSTGSTETEYLAAYRIDVPAALKDASEAVIGYDGYGSITIRVEDAPASAERHLFEYRNSYGLFERVLALGTESKTFSASDSEAKTYSEAMGDYVPSPDVLPSYQDTAQIETGYLNGERLNAFIALLSSPEVYIYRGVMRERVTVSCSSDFPARPTEPVSLTLSVATLAADSGFIPDMTESSRLHDSQFNEFFN